MKTMLLAFFLFLPSLAFANQVQVSMSPVTWYGSHSSPLCLGQPGCVFETFSASFRIDSITGVLLQDSMSISAFGVLGDFTDGYYLSSGHIGDTYWHNAAGDFIQLWPSEHCIGMHCFEDLRTPGIYGVNTFICSPALFGSCGYTEHSTVTVTGVPELPSVQLMGVGLSWIGGLIVMRRKRPLLART